MQEIKKASRESGLLCKKSRQLQYAIIWDTYAVNQDSHPKNFKRDQDSYAGSRDRKAKNQAAI